MVGNKPMAKFRAGSLEAAIFENQVAKNGGSYRLCKVVFQKNYLDRNDRWQSTSSLDINDVPKAVLVLSKTYGFPTSPETAKVEKTGEMEALA